MGVLSASWPFLFATSLVVRDCRGAPCAHSSPLGRTASSNRDAIASRYGIMGSGGVAVRIGYGGSGYRHACSLLRLGTKVVELCLST